MIYCAVRCRCNANPQLQLRTTTHSQPHVVQALMVLRHFPDTWLDFAAWHTRVGGAKSAPAAIEVLSRAVKVCAELGPAITAELYNSTAFMPGKGWLYVCISGSIHSEVVYCPALQKQ